MVFKCDKGTYQNVFFYINLIDKNLNFYIHFKIGQNVK